MNGGALKKANIALFVPLNGCPHRCSFCDQRIITGKAYQPTEEDVHNAVKTALSSSRRYNYEIAFFGGSFTAIDRNYMIKLLGAAYQYVKSGDVSGIRISTRPDAIDENVLDVLKSYGVTSIELGAQSMNDGVLEKNGRGHNAQAVVLASQMIKRRGFSLGLQMMTGLYGSNAALDEYTADKIIELSPDTVRIYPTVTLKGTRLEKLYESGEYNPMTLSESVNLCALLLDKFSKHNIEVIRLGLHYSEQLEKDIVYDNYHPAFRELCESKLMFDKFMEVCNKRDIDKSGNITVWVNPSCVSKFIGQKRANILKLEEMGYNVNVKSEQSVLPLEIKLSVES
ncbi:MAG: radical SAM protein [Clostridia bacterium]|nr:radical SAM protein [Clostridia bacterium]